MVRARPLPATPFAAALAVAMIPVAAAAQGGTAQFTEEPEVARPAVTTLQEADGHWSAANGGGAAVADLRVTAWLVLAYLADGSTMRSGPWRETVKNGVRWLVAQQDAAGRIALRSDPDWLLDHAMATVALAEAVHVSRYRLLQPKVASAVAALRAGIANTRPAVDCELRLWCELLLVTLRRAELRLLADAMVAPSLPPGKQWRRPPVSFDDVDLGAHALTMALRNLPPEPATEPTERQHAAQHLRDVLARRVAPEAKLPAMWPQDLLADPLTTFYVMLAQWRLGGAAWPTASKHFAAVQKLQQRQGPKRGVWEHDGAFGREHGFLGTTALTTISTTLYYRYCRLTIAGDR